jgi:hypothetical protein
VFYKIVGRDKRDNEVVHEVVFDTAMGGIIIRLLARDDIKSVTVQVASAAEFRKYQRDSKKG